MLTSKELQEQVAEQKRLLQSVASVGEELLSQQTTPNGDRYFLPLFFSHLLCYSLDRWNKHYSVPHYREASVILFFV